MSNDTTPSTPPNDPRVEETSDQSGGRSRILVVALVALVVVVLGAVAVWYFLIRADTPAELALDEDVEGSGEVVEDEALTGTWTVVPGAGDEATVAGYRIDEQFAAGALDHTAAGRTNDVTGNITVGERTVTEATITVDMTTLVSVDDRPDTGRRDNALRTRGLETDTFPEATFVLAEPIELPELVDGEAVTVPATGDLTLRDVTNRVTIDLQVRALGDTFTVQGQTPVILADYGIEPPSVPGFVTVTDEGVIELLVNFQRT